MTPTRIRPATSGLVVHNGCLLLVRGDWHGPDTYTLPGGGLEPGERLDEGVVREVFEETGVTVKAGPMLLVREHIPGRHEDGFEGEQSQRLDVLFRCEVVALPDTLGGSVPDESQTGVEWVPLDKVGEVRFVPPFLAGRIADLAVAADPGVYVGELL